MLQTYHTLVNALDAYYTKIELARGIFKHAEAFLLREQGFIKKYALPTTSDDYPIAKSGSPKLKIAQTCAIVFLNEEIFKAFLDTLPKSTARVLEVLVWQQHSEISALETELNLKIAEQTQRGFYHSHNLVVHPNFYFFKGAQDITYSQELSIPHELAWILEQYYPKPEGYYLEAVERPDNAKLIYEEGDVSISEEMVRLIHYHSQGKINRNKSGKILYSTANKTRKALKLREFFKDSYNEGTSIRTHLLLQLMGEGIDINQNDPIEVFVKKIFDYYLSGTFNALYALILHLKGTSQIPIYEQYNVGENYASILKHFPDKAWVSVENIFKYAQSHKMTLHLTDTYNFRRNLYFSKSYQEEGGNYKKYLNKSAFTEAFVHPSIKATFFLFAAWGLVDLAYNQPKGLQNEDYQSVFDGLKYIRLTDLGAYIIGKTKQYTQKNIAKGAKIILSDTSMSLYLTEEDEGKAIMLEPFAKMVSPQRFLIDYQAFLQDCKTPEDISKKIDIFKKTIDSDLPPIWIAFFENLKNKSNCFHIIGEHFTFHLEEDKELLGLLSREEKLKKLIIRAENYHIIVKKKNMTKLRNNLKEYGYLI